MRDNTSCNDLCMPLKRKHVSAQLVDCRRPVGNGVCPFQVGVLNQTPLRAQLIRLKPRCCLGFRHASSGPRCGPEPCRCQGEAQALRLNRAAGQSQWYHFRVGAPPILVFFSGDWDVHWGYDPWPDLGEKRGGVFLVCRQPNWLVGREPRRARSWGSQKICFKGALRSDQEVCEDAVETTSLQRNGFLLTVVQD